MNKKEKRGQGTFPFESRCDLSGAPGKCSLTPFCVKGVRRGCSWLRSRDGR